MKLMLTVLMLAVMATGAMAQTESYLFFSEYIEGSSNNKALEIFNNTDTDIDMTRVTIERYNNGGTEDPGSYTLFGTLVPQDVYVVANSGADQAILDIADDIVNSGATWYNGDDVLILYLDGIIVDVIGLLGEDPGSSWGTDPCTTGEHTLVRKMEICSGDIIVDDPFDPAIEWDCYDQDDFSFLGFHDSGCNPVATDEQTWGSIKSLYR